MDISPFYELRNRLYYAAAAGCSSISEDYRLKRAVEGFAPLSKFNKAFTKFYNMCVSLIESKSPSSEISDCIALADALAVTQGVYSDNDKAEPSGNSFCKSTGVPFSVIKDIDEKIRKRADSLLDIPESQAEYLRDPRIMDIFLDFMENGAQTSDFELFAEIVCTQVFGREIAPLLKASVRKSGRQIKYVMELCGADENGWYLSLAENKDNPEGVRKEAAEALSCSLSNTEKLIELYKTEKGKIKKAALMSLAKLSPPEAEPIFKKLCEKGNKKDMEYIRESHGKVCTEFVVKTIAANIEACSKQKAFKKAYTPALTDLINNSALIKNKTDESADKIMLLFCENDEMTAPINSFIMFVNQTLVRGIRDGRREETKAQIKRLYSLKPEYFKIAKEYVDFIENPEGKINMISSYRMLCILTSISYFPIIGKYNVEWWWDFMNHFRLPLVIIGDHFPQSVVDFFDASGTELINELEKLENGIPNNFDEAAKRAGISEINYNGRGDNIEKAVYRVGYYLHYILNMYIRLLIVGKCAEGDYERLKNAALSLAVKSASACSLYLAKNIITKFYGGSDEELVKINTKYTLNSVKYYDATISTAFPLVGDKSDEIKKAALEALERELPALEGNVRENNLNTFKINIKEKR